MTQYQRIEKYIEEFGSISPFEAFRDLGITKLATRIGEMTRGGYQVEKRLESAENRYGEKVHYMRYLKVV